MKIRLDTGSLQKRKPCVGQGRVSWGETEKDMRQGVNDLLVNEKLTSTVAALTMRVKCVALLHRAEPSSHNVVAGKNGRVGVSLEARDNLGEASSFEL